MYTKNVLFLLSWLLCFSYSNSLFAANQTLNPPRKITFLATADLQGRLDPSPASIKLGTDNKKTQVVGGITRIASLINEVKAEDTPGIPVVTVSAGDDLMGRYFHEFNGKAILNLLETAGYDLFVPGNHEFDKGSGLLSDALEQSNIPTLCSDLHVDGTAMDGECVPFVIKKLSNAMRIGFFSLMTPEFPYVTNGGNVSLKGSPFAIATEMVKLLSSKEVDLIVAVTHLGVELDQELAAKVDGIDLIIGGHSHEYLEQMLHVNNTLIVNGGEKGSALVRLDLSFDKDMRILADASHYSLIPVQASIAEDSKTSERLTQYSNKLPQTTVLGQTTATWQLDKQSVRNRESAVADMINDLILNKFKTDLVLNNSGAFRGNKEYPAGDVTNTMLHEIDAFENDIYLLNIKGKYLAKIMEHSAASTGHGGFLQIAGARITIDLQADEQTLVQKKNEWEILTPGSRVKTIQICDKKNVCLPLDAEKEYSVATNAFLAIEGGDKYFWLQKYGTDRINTYTSIYSIMAMEIAQSGILNPSTPDGRISFLEENK